MNKISVIGLDLAKYAFQVHGVDGEGGGRSQAPVTISACIVDGNWRQLGRNMIRFR